MPVEPRVATGESRTIAGKLGPLSEAQIAANRDSAACAAHPRQNVGNLERVLSVTAGGTLAVCGLARGKLSGLVLAALGGGLIYRGVTGHCQCYAALGVNTANLPPSTVVPAKDGYKVERSLTIRRSAEDLYRFWRDVENLPQVMDHLRSVKSLDNRRSHWVAKGAMAVDIEWDAEIFNEQENELIAWRSLPGGDVDTAGSIRFRPRAGDRGTEVTVSLKFNPPAGKLGANVASLLGNGLERQIADDLRKFKQLMEAGEVATTEGQPAGRAGW